MILRVRCSSLLLLAALTPAAHGADVFQIRTGYWALTWNAPEQPAQGQYRCLTPEDLEAMRFFQVTIPDRECTVAADGQSQTSTTWQIGIVCSLDEGPITYRYQLVASAPETLTYTVSVDGYPDQATGAGRWIADTCEPGALPIV